MALVLDNLAVLDDALDLRDQQGADTHYQQSESHCGTSNTSNGGSLTFFANKRVVSVVRVVSIASRSAAAIAEGAKVKFCSFDQSGFLQKKDRVLSYLEIHARTAQSDLSCTQVSSSGGNLGNNHGVLLVAQIKGFVGVRHGRVCLATCSVEQVAIRKR